MWKQYTLYMYILDLVYVSIIFGVYTVHIQQRNSVQPLCFLCVFFWFPPWSDWSGTFQNPWPLGCYLPRAASKDKRKDICWLLTLPFSWKMVLSFMTWSPVPANRCKLTILLDFLCVAQALNSQFWPRHWQSMVYFMVAGLAGFPFGAAFGGILLQRRPVQPKLEPKSGRTFEAKPDFSWDSWWDNYRN